MIQEVALLHIRPGQSAEFEAAFRQAQTIISAMPGKRSAPYTERMKPPALLLRLLSALILAAILVLDHQWRGQSFAQVPVWAWAALSLAVVVLLTQWPQRSTLPALRRVPLGWRVGLTVGLSVFLFTLADHALPRPDWGSAVFVGLTVGLFVGYVSNQSYAFKHKRP